MWEDDIECGTANGVSPRCRRPDGRLRLRRPFAAVGLTVFGIDHPGWRDRREAQVFACLDGAAAIIDPAEAAVTRASSPSSSGHHLATHYRYKKIDSRCAGNTGG